MLIASALSAAAGLLFIVLIATGVIGKALPGGKLLTPNVLSAAGLVDAANPRVLGRSDAPLTVDLWADFQCPHCEEWAQVVEPDFVRTYVATGEARLVYRDYTVVDMNLKTPAGESHRSAAAARCAGAQGQFWAFHDWLFINQQGEGTGRFSTDLLDQIAVRLGLNRGTFDACLADPATLAAVDAEVAQGQAAGVNGTPQLVIGGRILYRTSAGALTYDSTAADGTPNNGAGPVTMAELEPVMTAAIGGAGQPSPAPSVAAPAPPASASPTPAAASMPTSAPASP